MRIKVKTHEEAERLAKKFEQCHIEHQAGNTYLVVDKVKHRKRAVA